MRKETGDCTVKLHKLIIRLPASLVNIILEEGMCLLWILWYAVPPPDCLTHTAAATGRGGCSIVKVLPSAASSSVALCPFGAVSSLAFFRRPIDSIPCGSRSNGRAGVRGSGKGGSLLPLRILTTYASVHPACFRSPFHVYIIALCTCIVNTGIVHEL